MKIVRFSPRHVHLLEPHGDHVQVQCFLSPDYMRCTALGDITLAEFRALPNGGSRRYDVRPYDADERFDRWSIFAHFDHDAPCIGCYERERSAAPPALAQEE